MTESLRCEAMRKLGEYAYKFVTTQYKNRSHSDFEFWIMENAHSCATWYVVDGFLNGNPNSPSDPSEAPFDRLIFMCYNWRSRPEIMTYISEAVDLLLNEESIKQHHDNIKQIYKNAKQLHNDDLLDGFEDEFEYLSSNTSLKDAP